jgi:hypothetical protein
MRVFVIGDVGGHPSVFLSCLAQCGIVEDLRIPDGVIVVQVGDIVRCDRRFIDGNARCIDVSAQLLENNPGRFIQLAGNHEAGMLGGPRGAGWDRPEDCIEKVPWALLDRLWSRGRIRLAAGWEQTSLGPSLITHAGLTLQRWTSMGRPISPVRTAQLINADAGRPMATFSRAGKLSGRLDLHADTMWAEVNQELYGPWIAHGDRPFLQIHGHAAPFNWGDKDWWPDADAAVRTSTEVDERNRRTMTELPVSGQLLAISVDWMLGDGPWQDAPWPLLQFTIPEE